MLSQLVEMRKVLELATQLQLEEMPKVLEWVMQPLLEVTQLEPVLETHNQLEVMLLVLE